MISFQKFEKKMRNLLNVHDLLLKMSGINLNNEQMQQVAIMNQYKLMAATIPKYALPKMIDTGFKVYSQFDEDGILLYIFSLIGFTNRRVIELCAGSGEECNTANLIINHACHGILFDGNEKNVASAKKFFANNKATWLFPPICKYAWITKDNVNHLIKEEDFSGEIDFLSLDIDGNDYWIWEAINIVSPRVFVCEAHNICPDDMAITIPYKEDFVYLAKDNFHEEFRSASPLAMINLSKKKGYRLIGAHKYGFNLFFMRDDTGMEFFPEVSIDDVTNTEYTKEAKRTRWPAVKNAPWVNV